VFLLTGEASIGETWTITINDRAYSFRTATAADLDLAAIAQQLRDAINAAAAGYTASIPDPANPHQLIVQADTGKPSFYAGFQITHDLAGGATVSPANSSGATIAFTGVPAPGEV